MIIRACACKNQGIAASTLPSPAHPDKRLAIGDLMSASDFVGLWLHVLALAAYGGATLAVAVLLLPAAAAIDDAALRRRVLARAFRIYDPVAIAALGVIVMTGAFNLTRYKDAMRGELFARIGWLLVCKLSAAFAVVMLGTYIAFGLCHRIVRAEALEDPVDAAQLTGMLRRLSFACWLSLAILAIATWLGLAIAHPA
jgi:uncharacterized membrane protein